MTHRIRFHPLVTRDLAAIADWIIEYAGAEAAARTLARIEATVAALQDTPHKGSLRDDIGPGLRAIPAGRRAVIAFTVDDAASEVRIITISYAGADWAGRAARRKGPDQPGNQS